MTSPFQFTHLTSAHRAAMLAEIGVDSFDELIAQIPESIRLRNPLKLSPALPEWELRRLMLDLAGANASAVSHACFLGAGCYDHYVPAVVDAIAQRGEFLTSYTPYQPEMSQGLLAALYEYTVGVAKIFGQPVVNCSHYDGATALAEAAIMCVSARGQASIIAPQTLWPQHRAVLENYLWPRGISLSIAPMDEHRGELDLAALEEIVQRSPSAAVIVQSPNALGILENIPAIASLCRRHGTRLIVSTNPLLAGIQIPAGEQGADVVVGEGQALGLPMSAGGPHLGMMAVSQELRRWIPGRLVGKVTDLHGRDAFALVYEDREQHVARHRATSNICSNQALNSIRVAAYLALVGDSGLERIARENFGKAHLLQRALLRMLANSSMNSCCASTALQPTASAVRCSRRAFSLASPAARTRCSIRTRCWLRLPSHARKSSS
jgi:glycine dehydrogenase subunit 1